MSKKQTHIQVRGARTHNLKNIDVDIPLNKITCLYGPSGSGKSSLAFHTLLAESKRRYLNSLPNDVKFFWNMPSAADVDSIYPVLPVWGLAQTNPILGSRPNLADTIGLSEHLQRLWYDFGKEYCPEHKVELNPVDWNQIFQEYLKGKGWDDEGTVIHILLEKNQYQTLFGDGSIPARSYNFESSKIEEFNPEDIYWELFRTKVKNLEVITKRLKENGLRKGDVLFHIGGEENLEPLPSEGALKCPKCDYQVQHVQLEPTLYSPYNAAGACGKCSGHGMNLEYDREKVAKYPYLSIEEGAISILESSHFSYLYPSLVKELKKQKISLTKPLQELPQAKLWKLLDEGAGNWPGLESCYNYLESKRYKRTVRIFSRKLKSEVLCQTCLGTRVNQRVHNQCLTPKLPVNYRDIWLLSGDELLDVLEKLDKNIKDEKFQTRLKPIVNLVKVASELELGHIPLWKKAKKISSSEYQRALLTKILSYQGSGSLFVLDEPSFDLNTEDQVRLLRCLENIRDQGNTILLVEHSSFLIKASDHTIEMGPGAGPEGGEVLSAGPNKRKAKTPQSFSAPTKFKGKQKLEVKSFTSEDYDYQSLKLPLNQTTVVWGASGSKKNHYFNNVFLDTLNFKMLGEPLNSIANVREGILETDKSFEEVVVFDSSLGKVSSRSSVGTTIGLSPEVRKYFASLPVSRDFGLEKGHFSPNSDLGRCPTCEGKGIKEVEMSFLEDIILVCDDCDGKKLKPFLANISDGEITAYQAFNKPMSQVIPRLTLTPKFQKLWKLVEHLNLSYLSLDRSLSSLSGGERLRIKLLSQLAKKISNSFLFFDNISSGLSQRELEKLYEFINSLKSDGNTLLILDQNPQVIENSDFSIEFQ